MKYIPVGKSKDNKIFFLVFSLFSSEDQAILSIPINVSVKNIILKQPVWPRQHDKKYTHVTKASRNSNGTGHVLVLKKWLEGSTIISKFQRLWMKWALFLGEASTRRKGEKECFDKIQYYCSLLCFAWKHYEYQEAPSIFNFFME